MNNWQYHDNKMRDLKKVYNRISKQTRNELQSIFDSYKIDFEHLYNIADTKTLNRVKTKIEEWKDKGLLNGYFGMLANNIYKRTRVKNSEILELLIYGAYIEEQSKLEEIELNTFKGIMNYYYQQGQEEVNQTLPKKKRKLVSVIPDAIFLALLDMQNEKGYVWKQYVESIIKYNADQIYRQMLINIQQNKESDINDSIYQNIITKQQNAKLNINGDKISGAIDNELIGLNNLAKVEGIKSVVEDNSKVRFIAAVDGKETDMCHSLDGQTFYINKENEFDRYYGETQKDLRIQRIKCFGLVVGLNLPPISHHFHYCRSTITYQVPVEKQEKIEYNDLEYPEYIRLNVSDKYKPESEIDKIVNAITELPTKIRELIKNTEFEIFTKGKVIRNNKTVESSFYDRKEDKIYILTGNDLTKGEVIHEIGHAIETKLDLLNDNKYIEVRRKGLENYNIFSVQDLKEYKNTKGICNNKFISNLQGKIYYKDLQGNTYVGHNQEINLNCLGDYFSEAFREYFENGKNLLRKDKEIYNYIEEGIKKWKLN